MASVSISGRFERQPNSRVRRRGAILALLASLTLCSSGCTVFNSVGDSFRYNSVWNDAATKMRHRNLSSKSWHQRKHQFCNEACLDDFCAGYRQGFEDVAGGGSGCTPNFPPRDYWGWQHQSAEGQKKVSAWFAVILTVHGQPRKPVWVAGRRFRCPAAYRRSTSSLACCPIVGMPFTRLRNLPRRPTVSRHPP